MHFKSIISLLFSALMIFGLVGCGSGAAYMRDDTNITVPKITLVGSASMDLFVGGKFIDPGATAKDREDGDITFKVTVSGTVDMTKPGVNIVTYTVVDSDGNIAIITRTVNVKVRPNTAPTITLQGTNPMNLFVGDTFTDPGATANDKEDGDITSKILVTGAVDTTTAGTYTLTYTITDGGGLTDKTTRKVIVVTAPNTPPTITLAGNNPETIQLCKTYSDAGATADDKEDGDITSNIVTTSDVNISKVGTYTVTYPVTDSDGNTVDENRSVNVVRSLIQSNGVKKTGQIQSYAENGDLVAICSGADDGFYQKGVELAYVAKDLGDGNITLADTVTGLVWSDGPIVRRKWSDAKSYCNNLGIDGKSWRLPEMWELLSIVKKGPIGKATAIEDVFKKPISEKPNHRAYTWTNTYAENQSKHWTLRFNYGGIDVYDENSKELVRCVSGNATKIAIAPTDRSFSRDATAGVVTEQVSGLQWTDDVQGPELIWEQSIAYCEGSTVGGYDDWRLPNINEFYTLATYDHTAKQYPSAFTQIVDGKKYWSSTTIEFQPVFTTSATYNKGQAWLYKPSGSSDSISSPDKSGARYTMCVRNR